MKAEGDDRVVEVDPWHGATKGLVESVKSKIDWAL
jgi:hypothetical protein